MQVHLGEGEVPTEPQTLAGVLQNAGRPFRRSETRRSFGCDEAWEGVRRSPALSDSTAISRRVVGVHRQRRLRRRQANTPASSKPPTTAVPGSGTVAPAPLTVKTPALLPVAMIG